MFYIQDENGLDVEVTESEYLAYKKEQAKEAQEYENYLSEAYGE